MMKLHNPSAAVRRALTVAALTLVVHGAMSSQAAPGATSEVVPVTVRSLGAAPLLTPIEVVRVTAKRPTTAEFDVRIETDATALIEVLDRRVDEERELRLDEIAPTRIKLVLSEVPTRG